MDELFGVLGEVLGGLGEIKAERREGPPPVYVIVRSRKKARVKKVRKNGRVVFR